MTEAEPGLARVVVISPVLPFDGITHAGGLYLQTLRRALESAGAEVTFLVDGSNYWAVNRRGAPDRVVLLGVPLKRTLLGRASARAVRELERVLQRWYPTWPRLPFALHLMASPSARSALREADVVDLHWPETTHLVPWVRRLNPHARVITTLHDVLTQRLSRRGQPLGRTGERGLRTAHALERATLARADHVVVFSEKDRGLLPYVGSASRALVEVVAPPLATDDVLPRTPNHASPVVLFVGLLDRPENGEAALSLVEEIWPVVSRRVPAAHLRIVGAGGSDELRDGCAAAPNVELTGFVPDLAAEYAEASACVVPLKRGAGVKFKTVEAVVAGVPVVSTTVGTEGVGPPDRFAAVVDDAVSIADALVRVLEDPEGSECIARGSQSWARKRFHVSRFREDVRRIYGLGTS